MLNIDKNRGSINLELALIITLLVLVAVISLSFMAYGISDQFNEAGSYLVGGSGPDGLASADNGDGTYTLTWNPGTPPYTVYQSANPDMSGAVAAVDGDGDDTDESALITPPVGDSYYQIEDGNGVGDILGPITVLAAPIYEPDLTSINFEAAVKTGGGDCDMCHVTGEANYINPVSSFNGKNATEHKFGDDGSGMYTGKIIDTYRTAENGVTYDLTNGNDYIFTMFIWAEAGTPDIDIDVYAGDSASLLGNFTSSTHDAWVPVSISFTYLGATTTYSDLTFISQNAVDVDLSYYYADMAITPN